MSSTLKAGREFCRTCGWPIAGLRCDACGSDGAPRAVAEPPQRFSYRVSVDPRLDRAFEAFDGRDYPRMVSFCLAAEPTWTSRAVTFRDGPAWVLTVGDASVFLSIDADAGLLVIESPLARLAERHRVAALRYALEISASPESASRVCLRGDLLVLRFAGRLSSVNPTSLFDVVARSAALSEVARNELVTRFDARPAIASEQRGAPAWDVLGKSRAIDHLAPPASPRSLPPPPPDAPPPEVARVPVVSDSIPPILAPSFVAAKERPPSIPPILAPSFVASSKRSDSIPPILAPPSVEDPGSRKSADPLSLPRSESRPTLNDLLVEAPPRGNLTPPPMTAVSPEAERLCELLRQAQTLATALSFEERPVTMLLLVRATVFRAVYAHEEKLPDVVALLYRGAGAAVKEIWLTAGRRSQALTIPTAEPALLVMERIVGLHAQVPKEKRVVVDPLTSATQAKEHLARYLSEIEKAPLGANLRHFLALGALTELLVRSKLPPQTQQRLREIVLYAHREEKKTESIDLMMTALGRIVAT